MFTQSYRMRMGPRAARKGRVRAWRKVNVALAPACRAATGNVLLAVSPPLISPPLTCTASPVAV